MRNILFFVIGLVVSMIVIGTTIVVLRKRGTYKKPSTSDNVTPAADKTAKKRGSSEGWGFLIVDKAIGLLCLVVIITIAYTVFTSGKAFVKMSLQPAQVVVQAPEKRVVETTSVVSEPGKWSEWTTLNPKCLAEFTLFRKTGDTLSVMRPDSSIVRWYGGQGLDFGQGLDSIRVMLPKGGSLEISETPSSAYTKSCRVTHQVPAEKPKPPVSNKATNIA
jgi:hypothetical protein